MEWESIENLCRTCANKEENMTLINSSLIVDANVIIISDLLKMFNVECNKNLPCLICPVCLGKVLSAHEFKLQCQKSTAMFHNIIDNKKTLNSEVETDVNDTLCDYNDNTEYYSDGKLDVKDNSAPASFPKECNIQTSADVNTLDTTKHTEETETTGLSDTKNSNIFEKINKVDIVNNDLINPEGIKELGEKQKASKRKGTNDVLMFCAECNKSFKNKYILISHVKRHKNKGQFLCSVCGKGFNAQSCLSRHVRIHTGERNYECEVCHKRFPSANNLTLHSRRHSGIKPYLCTLCGKCFSHPTGLTYHIRTHTKEKPYPCDVCGRRFTIQCHRERHRKTHSGERPFPCNMCDRAFIKKFDLQRHQDVHLGNKPHVCSICNKAFVRKMHLNYHMMVHTEERPHVCTHCGKGFIRRYYLTSHVKKHHTTNSDSSDANVTFDMPG